MKKMEKLNVLITSSFESTRDAMGFSEDEGYSSDAVLFQQGFNMNVLIVKPGEKFKIEAEFKGQIDCEETLYKFVKLKEEWDDEFDEFEEEYSEEGDLINLQEGNYHFLDDGLTIEELPNNTQ